MSLTFTHFLLWSIRVTLLFVLYKNDDYIINFFLHSHSMSTLIHTAWAERSQHHIEYLKIQFRINYISELQSCLHFKILTCNITTLIKYTYCTIHVILCTWKYIKNIYVDRRALLLPAITSLDKLLLHLVFIFTSTRDQTYNHELSLDRLSQRITQGWYIKIYTIP